MVSVVNTRQWCIAGCAPGTPCALDSFRPSSRTLRNHYGWRRGVVVSGVCRMNEVNARRARLQLGWVTVFGRVYHLAM